MQFKTTERIRNVLLTAGLAVMFVHAIGFLWFQADMQAAKAQVINQMFLAFAAVGVSACIYLHTRPAPEWLRSLAIVATCFGTPCVFILL